MSTYKTGPDSWNNLMKVTLLPLSLFVIFLPHSRPRAVEIICR